MKKPADNPEKRKAQRTVAGISFIIFLAIVVLVGFLNGELFGDTLQQKIFAIVIGSAVIIGVFVLLFRRSR